ncbi:MACPF domain-containing protein At1g14780 isoform X2 [Malania oleifera]|uniref:MACPF domain-containing protein At1g14780 isoform X2 n=1 Tax=Malania oleifera TaxID=397392 RepID=UPI0025ADFC96|nr:MACPF domain-containing protein At1g14780 isoform X2 [Malania oleifera]
MGGDEGKTMVEKAVNSLGKGFDFTSDFRLDFCKGNHRLVLLNESKKKELLVPNFGAFKDVSVDIKCDRGERTRYRSDVLQFNQMSEFFNGKSSVGGKIPSGEFNAMFGFESGSWAEDAANTSCLALDGYFITLFNLHLDRYPLALSQEVRDAVPSTWDPCGLARFIKTYGTHIIIGLSMGGRDIVLVRQEKSSNLESSEIKKHLEDLGDQLFNGTCTYSPHHCKTKEQKRKGIIVICSRRGGDVSANSHYEWLLTVPSMPDAIRFNFIPITSLLKRVPGIGFLSHAINLYLRYKPPVADLQYFLDFQAHKIWAPIHNDLPLGPLRNKAIPTPALHFNLMGPKLYVNTTQVKVGKRPVTGMRLYLEGMKCNRLAIHLQHLSNTPLMLQNRIEDVPIWRSSEHIADDRYFEPIQRKNFSHICTAPVKYDPTWAAAGESTAFIITGAQLYVKKHASKSVLHLRLLFSKATDSSVVQSRWAQGSSDFSQRSGFFSTLSTSITGGGSEKEKPQTVVVDSGVFPTGPPVQVQAQTQKLLKVVDMSQLCKGPQDGPGHWLVTGARMELEKGKICLHVKFSLLSVCSERSEEAAT